MLKVTSLLCLYNISKKELWIEFSNFDLSYRFFMKVTRHVQSTEKWSLLNFSNILRKSIATAFLFYCDAKHSDTLLGSSHVCCYFFGGWCGRKWAWSFDHQTLKFFVSQGGKLIKWANFFFACWYKFRKANVNLVIIGWGWSKMVSYKN